MKACLIETKGEEQTESMKEEPTKPPDVNIPVEEDYTSWRGETELRTNETLECRKRKQITEQLMDHQTEYNKKMKLKQKKQRSFKVDDFAQIRFLVKSLTFMITVTAQKWSYKSEKFPRMFPQTD